MNGISDFTTELEEIQYSPGYINELEHKIQFLEKQNKCYKEYKLEAERLQMELKHITTLKETYEEKYNEASMKLLYIEDDDSIIFSESEQVKTLNQKVSILLHANQDLLKEIEENKKWIQEITNERDLLKDSIKKLQNSIKALELQVETKEFQAIDASNKSQSKLISEEDSHSQIKIDLESSLKLFKKVSIEEPEKKSASPEQKNSARNSFKCNTLAISVSPVARSMNTPKLAIGRFSPSRQSPKLKHLKKKSQYIPSFLRKPSKDVKKINVT